MLFNSLSFPFSTVIVRLFCFVVVFFCIPLLSAEQFADRPRSTSIHMHTFIFLIQINSFPPSQASMLSSGDLSSIHSFIQPFFDQTLSFFFFFMMCIFRSFLVLADRLLVLNIFLFLYSSTHIPTQPFIHRRENSEHYLISSLHSLISPVNIRFNLFLSLFDLDKKKKKVNEVNKSIIENPIFSIPTFFSRLSRIDQKNHVAR